MSDPEEIEQIKAAFEKFDRGGNGQITREALGHVFRGLEGNAWSEEDLQALFDLVDKRRTGLVNYDSFVQYVMQDDDTAPSQETHDDHGHADQIANLATLNAVDIDLKQKVKKKEFVMIASRFGVDPDDAEETFEHVVEQLVNDGVDTQDGVIVEEFFDELDIDIKNKSALSVLKGVLEVVQGKIWRNEDDSPSHEQPLLDRPAMQVAVDKLLRELDFQRRPFEDAWAVFEEGNMPLSRASTKLVAQFEGNQDALTALLKESYHSPRSLPSMSGQAGNREQCVAKVTEIIHRCKASGMKFTDPEWDLTRDPNAMLYVDRHKPGYDCTVGKPSGYKRLTEIIKADDGGFGGSGLMALLAARHQQGQGPVLYKGTEVQETDIIQGQIGTCFLLGAIGSIINKNNKVVKSWFMKYDVEVGVYGVRFNLDSEWVHVIVDDIMPVNAYGELLYAQSKDPQEVWCCVLEKAFCKLHTCYEMCDGGTPSEAIFSLFGGVGGRFIIEKKHQRDPKLYYNVLKNADDNGWLLTTGFNPPDPSLMTGQGKCGEAVCDSGLVGGHVYSLIQLVEAHGECLVQIRNPWGQGEWKGKWSDANRYGEWTEEMKAATSSRLQNDGTFWMSIEDLVKDSIGVNFSRTFGPEWKKITHYRRFVDAADLVATAQWAYEAGADDEISFNKGDAISVISFHKSWWYGHIMGRNCKSGYFPGNYVKLVDRPVMRFDIVGIPDEQEVKVVPIIMQENSMMKRKFYRRKEDGLNYKDTSYPHMELIAVGPDGRVAWKKSGMRRELWGELKVARGATWKLYCVSVDGRGAAFVFRSYVQGGACEVRQAEGAQISEVLDAIARK